MLQKPKNWLAETLWKPKKTHSPEQLKYLHYILQRNSTVTDSNKGLVVETLRSIAEILIWGDQNDSTVFDFFLEKNMLLFFLKFMTQNCGSYVTVQLLQTLNILFENIRSQTSLYFLLSNNHVNSIIVHKFDFSNEEVLAYYISFLKTLSLKLNLQTINFFFNERKGDFPLYTEAIKFFHHPESMVRIAVRTLTLNVYKVGHEKMLEFICDKTATPYFSNLIWLIGKDAIELDDCVLQETDHFKYDKLKANVADHLDHLHYLNDILLLEIDVLNMILTDHMVNRLLIPLYIYSLPSKDDLPSANNPDRVHIGKLVALFLLAQHLLIMDHTPLVNAIIDVMLNENEIRSTPYTTTVTDLDDRKSILSNGSSSSSRAFIPPPAPLESQLEACGITRDSYNLNMKLKMLSEDKTAKRNSKFYITGDGDVIVTDEDDVVSEIKQEEKIENAETPTRSSDADSGEDVESSTIESVKELALVKETSSLDVSAELPVETSSPDVTKDCISNEEVTSENRLFLRSILKSLDCIDGDSEAFFAICLLYTILSNKGVERDLLIDVGLCLVKESEDYNSEVMEYLLKFLEEGLKDGSTVRLVTFEMCIQVIRLLTIDGKQVRIKDEHLAMLQNIREASTLQLRSFYKGDSMFVDTFEGQYHRMKAKPLNVEYVTMDASLLLPPTATPLTGIDFIKRLPCGDTERTQRASHIFILLRELVLNLENEPENYLPLSKVVNPVRENEVLDLNNSDLIACTIIQKEKQINRRFLVIDTSQFILVEPDTSKLGWGVVKFVSHLQDVEATPDKDDSRSLHIVIQQPFTRRSKSGFNPLPVLTAKFVFDDYIRCMSARQRLQKRCDAFRHRKMSNIATLLELPALASPTNYYSITSLDNANTVWSPSSRGYSASRHQSGQSSPVTPSSTVPNSSTAFKTPQAKSRLLSPKMEQILQRQQQQDDKKTPSFSRMSIIHGNNDLTPHSTPSRTEAVALASLLQTSPPLGPVEITGTADNLRERTSTMEVGEELIDESVSIADSSSSFILINEHASIERSKQNNSKIKDLISRSKNEQAAKKEACQSAPGSPRGRKAVHHFQPSTEDRDRSSSLPPVTLTSAADERKQRAHRARAKAKTAARLRGGKK